MEPAALAACLDKAGLISIPWVMGMWPRCSTPPTTNMSPFPVMIACTALCNADMDEPQRRLTVWPGTSCGITDSNAAMRATLTPCSRVWLTQPHRTSSTSAGSSLGLRANRPLISAADMSSARVWRKQPFLDRPIGVRAKSTITASLGFRLIYLLPLAANPKKASPLAAISRSFSVGTYMAFSGPAAAASSSALATNLSMPTSSM